MEEKMIGKASINYVVVETLENVGSWIYDDGSGRSWIFGTRNQANKKAISLEKQARYVENVTKTYHGATYSVMPLLSE
jgi:hypothetical protein